MIMTQQVGVEALTPAYLTLRVEVADAREQLRIAKSCRQEMVSRNASGATEVQDKSPSGNALLTKPDLSLADAGYRFGSSIRSSMRSHGTLRCPRWRRR